MPVARAQVAAELDRALTISPRGCTRRPQHRQSATSGTAIQPSRSPPMISRPLRVPRGAAATVPCGAARRARPARVRNRRRRRRAHGARSRSRDSDARWLARRWRARRRRSAPFWLDSRSAGRLAHGHPHAAKTGTAGNGCGAAPRTARDRPSAGTARSETRAPLPHHGGVAGAGWYRRLPGDRYGTRKCLRFLGVATGAVLGTISVHAGDTRSRRFRQCIRLVLSRRRRPTRRHGGTNVFAASTPYGGTASDQRSISGKRGWWGGEERGRRRVEDGAVQAQASSVVTRASLFPTFVAARAQAQHAGVRADVGGNTVARHRPGRRRREISDARSAAPRRARDNEHGHQTGPFPIGCQQYSREPGVVQVGNGTRRARHHSCPVPSIGNEDQKVARRLLPSLATRARQRPHPREHASHCILRTGSRVPSTRQFHDTRRANSQAGAADFIPVSSLCAILRARCIRSR